MLWADNRKEDYRGAVAEIAAAFRPGDLVVAVTGMPDPFSRAGLAHYLRDHPQALATIRHPSQLASELAAPGRAHVLLRNRRMPTANSTTCDAPSRKCTEEKNGGWSAT